MRSTGTGAMTTTFARGAVWSWIGHAVVRSFHAVVPGVLALALLSPSLGVLLASLQEPDSSCDMSCCSGSHCRCHEASSIENHGDPGWTAVAACPDNCCRAMGLPASAGNMLPAGRIRIGSAQQSESQRVRPNLQAHRAESESALFERPPPSAI